MIDSELSLAARRLSRNVDFISVFNGYIFSEKKKELANSLSNLNSESLNDATVSKIKSINEVERLFNSITQKNLEIDSEVL